VKCRISPSWVFSIYGVEKTAGPDNRGVINKPRRGKMKKVIAAAAGLMLVGTMVGSAAAAVSFGGDGRARYYYQTNYDFGAMEDVTNANGNVTGTQRENEKENKWHSRVRIQARAEAAGGAYAVGRADYGNSTWDGGNSNSTNVGASKAYIGVPIGPVTIEAGRVPMDLLVATKFLFQDVTVDGAKVMFNVSDTAELGLLYTVDYEATQNGDLQNDNDVVNYGAYAQMGFAGGMSLRIAGLYEDDQVGVGADDGSGWFGGIEFTGPAGSIALSGALAGDDRGEERADTGYGGFIQGGMDFGGTGVALNVGFTADGFVTDGDFGFIMIGGGYSITPTSVGALGDTWWIGVPVTFAVSEMLSLKAVLAYADFDTGGDAFEISGSAKYLISDGLNFQWDIGYLGYSADTDTDEEESPFGTAITFNVSF